MDIKDQIKNKEDESNKLEDSYYNNLRRSLKRCEIIKKSVSSFSKLEKVDERFNTLKEAFGRFKIILEAEIKEICNKISQIEKDSDKVVEYISELAEYVLCLSNLINVIVKIQKKSNELEYNICEAKSDIAIDNFDVIVIKEFYDLVLGIKHSMYKYFIGIPEEHLNNNSYTSSNKLNIKNTYEEIMEQLNKIMVDVGVSEDLYERPFYENIISNIEAWRNNFKRSIPFGMVEY